MGGFFLSLIELAGILSLFRLHQLVSFGFFYTKDGRWIEDHWYGNTTFPCPKADVYVIAVSQPVKHLCCIQLAQLAVLLKKKSSTRYVF